MSDYTDLIARLAVAAAEQTTTALADTVHEAEVAIVALSDRVEKAQVEVARLQAVQLRVYEPGFAEALATLCNGIDPHPKASGA